MLTVTRHEAGIYTSRLSPRKLLLPQVNEPATPTLAFGDGDTGFYEVSDDVIYVSISGTQKFYIAAASLGSISTGGGVIKQTGASATIPSLMPNAGDTDTGIGTAAADQLSLIAGGVEAIRISSTFTTVYGSLTVVGAIQAAGADTTLSVQARNFTVTDNAIEMAYGTFSGAGVTQAAVVIKPTINQTTTSAMTDLLINRTETAVGSGAQLLIDAQVGSVSKFSVSNTGALTIPSTITAPGTTGNQTINKPAGRVNIAAAGTTVTVTNSLVTANSIVLAVAATADATARVTSVVPAAGSFVINTVAVTAETAFNFLVIS